MTDKILYQLCKRYGENALHFRRKFLGLLPEVFKRKLHEKKGFGSIFEFAAKLCGVSEELVRRVLNLEKRFEMMPVLKGLLERGEVSVNKLARVASIATPENAVVLAAQVKLLPQKALETLVRDEKLVQKPFSEDESVRAHIKEPRLDDDVKEQLAGLQGKGIDINELIRKMLANREEEIAGKKKQAGKQAAAKAYKNRPSRYVSIRIKKLLKEEHGDKCSIPHCGRMAAQVHHSQRFALSRVHDPRYMAPMCAEHHRIAHSIDLKVQDARAG